MTFTFFRRFDWILFFTVVALIAFGIVAIWSVDLSRNPESLINFKKQIIFALSGIVLLLAAPFFDWRIIKNISRHLYVAGFFLLLAVLFFGQTHHGATGWFNAGGFNIQPVEIAKITLILALARYFSYHGFIPNWKIAIKGVFLLTVYLIPVLLQPDFGGAAILFAIWLGMTLMLKFPKKILIYLCVALVVTSTFTWFVVLKDYQRNRIITFVQPGSDPKGSGYNITQSIVAIGAGGLTGRGLGAGSQSQLRFLPEAHTDFIFAVLGEELGFIGTTTVIISFIIILMRLTQLTHTLRDNFALFVILGTELMIASEALVNIGMNIGLLPVTGLPLPLVSYGGSALISTCFLLAIAQSIRIRSAT